MGALVLGVLVASPDKTDELAKTMAGFKGLFLPGFFRSIRASRTGCAAGRSADPARRAAGVSKGGAVLRQ